MKSSWFLSLIAMMVLLLGGGSTVLAQEGDALRFFQQNPSGRLFFRGEPPPPPRAARPRDSDFTSRRRAVPEPDPLAQPAVPVTTFVHILGDSLSEHLSQGLKEHLAESKPELGVIKRSRSSSGLVRDDYFDWPKAVRELLAGTEKVDAVVMMLGSNDRQALRDEAGSYEFGSDRWRELYGRRVDDVIALLRERNIPFVVVGMPAMQGQKLSADMLVVNTILKDRAAKGAAGYVDIWEAFANEQGQYVVNGPDVNGEIVRLRTSDGIHFTKAGARKLGFFVGKELDPQLKRDGRGVAVAALPSDLSEQIKRDAPGLVPLSLQAALPLPEELPIVPMIGLRPLAGPTFELTGAPVSTGGRMWQGRVISPANEMSILVEQAFSQGKMPPAKAGRSDDFTWPRQENAAALARSN
jgi:hypothetical protein